MNEFLEKLADGHTSQSSPDHLKLLGKRAAGLFAKNAASSLNDAVSQVASEEGVYGREQVSRISEAANQAAWQSFFHETGDGSAAFEPASSSAVLESLSEKAPSSEEPILDFLQDPPGETLPNIDLMEAFGVKEPEPYEDFNPAGEAEQTQVKLSAAQDMMRYSADRLGNELTEKRSRFLDLVKRAHVTDGNGFLQICRAVGTACQSSDFAKELMTQAKDHLEASGVVFNNAQEAEKLAHAVVVNTDHPLMLAAAELEKLSSAYQTALRARGNLETGTRRVNAYLRDKIRGA